MQSEQFYLHADLEQRHWLVARRRILHALVREVVAPGTGATIVDVGCGTGANLAGLNDDYRSVGIDTSADAIRLARERFPTVRWIHGFAPQDLGDEISRARLVVLSDVLEHVRDDFALLSSLLAATEPGTYFLLTVPADRSLWTQHDESFGHFRRYDRAGFTELWRGLPVTTVLASHYNARLYRAVKWVRRLNQWRGRASGSENTDFRLPNRLVNAALTQVFADERRALLRSVRGAPAPFKRGVSLIALLRREEGTIRERRKPAWAMPDLFNPALTVSSASTAAAAFRA